MSKIKYIYFEIKYVKGVGETQPKICNENALLFKPVTNSSGIWGFKNMTERKNLAKPTFSIVQQYWIDLDKFEKEEREIYSEIRVYVNEVLDKLTPN